ncbi:HNH endonuclease signature motif containing protein [Leifsonia sp. Root112D2]|uniref:HNH endonuclease signature motif containing protein n=1 Tax=Leifsonia sp. Root112D2 TaxID=1736426 RepID=UPI0006F34AED|nr:HNH endonuclease signature motif containing protein [Leifsonia sp. Root112D2]KQV08133.1 hypothetical protein ASC63_13410 [Leifsonia sp. Root112D2]
MHTLTYPPALDTLLGLLASVFGDVNLDDLSDEQSVELLGAAEEVGRLVDASRVRLAANVTDRSRPGLGREALCVKFGCRTASDVITRVTAISVREAARRIRLGTVLIQGSDLLGAAPLPLPLDAESFLQGDLGMDSAENIVAGLVPIRHRCDPDGFTAAERALVVAATGTVIDEAAELPGAGIRFAADLVRTQAQLWQARIDPDGAAPESIVMHPRSTFGFGRLKDGVYPLRGGVTPELRGIMNGIFDTYLSARSVPSFPGEQETRSHADDGSGGSVDLTEAAAGPRSSDADTRGADEKRADILRGVFGWAVRHPQTPTMGGAAPTVMVHVNARDLADGVGVGWVDGVDAPVSMRTVRQLICAGGYRKVVFGENGEVLHLGRKERFFSGAQRRAIAARDGGCVIPGCTAPVQWAEVHHVVAWHAGGATDVENGVLLCWFHHHEIDCSGWQIRMIRGRPEIKAPPWLDRSATWRIAAPHRAATASRPDRRSAA